MEFGSYNNLAQHRMCSFFFFFKITPPYRTWTILLYNFTTSSAHFSQLWYLTRHSFKSAALFINIYYFFLAFNFAVFSVSFSIIQAHYVSLFHFKTIMLKQIFSRIIFWSLVLTTIINKYLWKGKEGNSYVWMIN